MNKLSSKYIECNGKAKDKAGKSGYVMVPYQIMVTKTILNDENHTTETWQINK
jgi:hypothetical protein